MIILVTGGARSGKSSFAESFYKDKSDVVYIATSRIEDDEMKQRVEHHRSSRPANWRTFEGTYNLEDAIGDEKRYLLDCITVLTSNIMFDLAKDAERIGEELQKEIEKKTGETSCNGHK
jgi:adenosylcobinamide kinase/adenosylcobinamide-phosphate guanylyltransferase